MDYRGAYRDLALSVLEYGMVLDFSYFGCASRFKKDQVIIVVNPALSWRNRLFTLAHEIGHVFRLEGQQLVLAKRTGSEAQANQRAVKLLEQVLEEDVSASYYSFYNRVLRLPKPESWNHIT